MFQFSEADQQRLRMQFVPAHPPQPPQRMPAQLPPTQLYAMPLSFAQPVGIAAQKLHFGAPSSRATVAPTQPPAQPPTQPPCPKTYWRDQYTVRDQNPDEDGCSYCCYVCTSTTWHHKVEETKKGEPGAVPSPLLGNEHGHVERSSVWTHIIGALIFAAYAVIRSFVVNTPSFGNTLATAAAVTTAATFASSSVYHATAPSKSLAAWSRILDFTAIYASLVVVTITDLSLATDEFRGIPWVAIADAPFAGTIIAIFFLWRRLKTPTDQTWEHTNDGVVTSNACSLGHGLQSFAHLDLSHSSVRQATSLILAGFYFVTIPASVATLGYDVAMVTVALQGAGFALLVFGMVLDRLLLWPNQALAQGKADCLVHKKCGCVMKSHAIWHVLAVLSAALASAGREYALSKF